MEALPPIAYVPAFVPDAEECFTTLRDELTWDTRMKSRLTASMGEPYDYSGIVYPRAPWHPLVAEMCPRLIETLSSVPDNCLLNLYPSGRSRMGWHSDDLTQLQPGTGVAIVSLGAARSLHFREKPAGPVHTLLLEPGSLLFMPAGMQRTWQHALPASPGALGRISLTFRRLRPAAAQLAPDALFGCIRTSRPPLSVEEMDTRVAQMFQEEPTTRQGGE